MLFKSRRAQRRALLAVALCAGAVGVVPAAAQASGSSNLALPKVMTRNLYLGRGSQSGARGARLSVTPQPCLHLVRRTRAIWNQVVATNFPARAKVLAKEIDNDDPYIIGLQEVALWRSGPINGVKDATVVEYDFLDDPAARARRRAAPSTRRRSSSRRPTSRARPQPTCEGSPASTMRDVILVRTDLPKALVSFSNPQSGNYANFISISSPGACPPSCYGAVEFKRGWTSIDIKLLGHPVARFVNTHLESVASGDRWQQACELVGPDRPAGERRSRRSSSAI